MAIVYSTGGPLNQALGNLGAGVGGALGARRQQKKEQQYGTILEEELEKLGEGASPQDTMNAILGATGRGVPLAKVAELAAVYSNLSKPRRETEYDKQLVKSEFRKEELAEKGQGFLNIIKELRTKLPFTGSQAVPGKGFDPSQVGIGKYLSPAFNRKALEERENFNNLAFSLEGFLREMSTKGHLPQKTFQELLKKLPNAKLSDRENTGRINAIETMINSSLGSLNQNKSIEGDGLNQPTDKTFSKLPNPSLFEGRRIQDESSGKIFISDGKHWKVEG